MDWRMLIFSFLQLTKSDTEVLLDTSKFTTELSQKGWIFPNNSKWQDVSGLNDLGNTVRVLQVCDVKSKNQNNWVESPYINTNGAKQIELEIKFAIRSCKSLKNAYNCLERFAVFYRRAASEGTEGNDWIKLDTIADSGVQTKKFQIELDEASNGLFLAFQDTGSCTSVSQVKLSYNYCPSIVRGFAQFAKTLTKIRHVEVEGQCVANGEPKVPDQKPVYYCGSDGEWILIQKDCQCLAGFEADEENNQCLECPAGTYKNIKGVGNCIPCPERSTSYAGATNCTCDRGTFRSETDSIDGDCKAPPKPIDIADMTVKRSSSKIQISWPKSDDDVTHRVRCFECKNKKTCKICPRSIKLPQPRFTKPEFELSGLDQLMDYKIEIAQDNPITMVARQLSPDFVPAETIIYSDKILEEEFRVVNLRLLSVSSDEARFLIEHRPKTVEYDQINIELNGLTREINQKENEFSVGYLAENADYSIRLNIKSTRDELQSDWSTFLDFKTSSNIIEQELLQNDAKNSKNSWIAGIITGVSLIVICILIFILILFRRKTSDEWTKGTRSSIEQFSVATTSSGQGGSTMTAAVDLIPCRTNVSDELNLNKIEMGSMMATGRLGKITSGHMFDRRIAIKHLSMHHFELNEDYMRDLRAFSKFDYEYLIRIEGFVTKSYPNLIIMELMDLGTLQKYLLGPENKPEIIYPSMMRDIADGMAFLHAHRFILRHLDMEHVMVSSAGGGLAIPIFKLKLSSKYIIENGTESRDHISVRQLAPEVIQQHRFTPESDIWSFGVLMWQVIAQNEEPYWGLSSQQVIEAVRGGWRLPKPNLSAGHISEKLNDDLHELMLICWEELPPLRTPAKVIQAKLEQIIQNLATQHSLSDDNKNENIPGIPV